MNKGGRFLFFKLAILIAFIFFGFKASCQNQRILCYFNHPVNTAIASGINAVYLNGSFADTIAAYINRAKYTVDIAQYDYTSSASSDVAVIAQAANAAVGRGVIVRWIYDGSSSNSGLSLLNSTIKTLGSPTTSAYGIMHNKFMVVDANAADTTIPTVMTGSYDWSAEQTNSDFNNLLFIQDKNIALAYYKEFNKMWGGTASSPNSATETFGKYKAVSNQYLFNVNGTPVELYFSPEDTVGKRLQNSINTANYEIFFGIYTFTDNTIAKLIKTDYNNGIAVKGIMDQYSTSYSPYSTLNPVLGNNLQIYSTNYIYHNKIMLIDALHPSSDPQVFTGSFNWSISAETMNDENAIIIHDASIANQYEQSLCQNFSDIGGAPCVTPVAVRLLYFNVTPQSNQTLLSWATADANVQYFQVEQSLDGINYNSIVTINSTTNSTDEKTYSYIAANTNAPVTYYLIKEVDNYNNITYSDIETVTAIQNMDATIYPNPATDMLTVNLVNANNTIRIINYLGQIIKVINEPAAGSIKIPINDLQNGVYTIEIMNATEKTIKSFIKE